MMKLTPRGEDFTFIRFRRNDSHLVQSGLLSNRHRSFIKGSGKESFLGKILIAGMGNVLRGDDGFGVEVVKKIREENLPNNVEVIEVGIAGLTLVQELMDRYDVLILVDATKRGGSPGMTYVIEPDVPEMTLDSLDMKLLNYLADGHYVEPSKVLRLARGLGILPKKVFIVGCEPAVHEEFYIGLTESVGQAVKKAVRIVLDLVAKAN